MTKHNLYGGAVGLAMLLGLSACTDPYDPAQRTVGGGLLGAATGAAIGAAVGGGHGAALGAAIGGATGDLAGAATTPPPPPPPADAKPPVKPISHAFDRGGLYAHSERRPAVAALRLQDMDRDSVETQVIFGPIFHNSTDDPALRQACYRVYNDWLMEFCATAPNRLIGVPMLPETDPAAAHAELRRLAAKGGVRQVCLMCAQANPKFDDPAWEPLCSALEDTGIILSWHITVFGVKPSDRAAGKAASVFANTKGFLDNFLEPFVDLFAWA